ncbi:acyltransferase [Polycyclovorans algicola]|uniref:acyltransferase n=1 Tax=Polycyclovorans algicola TaxID=616992 RepID=UPI001F2062EB|nr:acyltransferase [Polycyclovorans algicola]
MLTAPMIGVLTFALKFVVLIFWFTLMLPGVVLHLLPSRALRDRTSRYCVFIARRWVGTNRRLYRLVHPMDWEVTVEGALDPTRNYLVVSNHQSWADILILFAALHGRMPFLRFFLKDQLKYIPIIGQVCWAMEFPFMKRHSKEALAKNPALRSEDLETTRRKCEVYKRQPVALVNFLEGTRFTPAKHLAQASPYAHLLKPKSAGLAFTLNAMGEQFAGLVDVTLVYAPTREGRSRLWSWLCGEQGHACLHIAVRAIPSELMRGNYEHDVDYRARFHQWVAKLWAEKDARISGLKNPDAETAPGSSFTAI